MTKELVKSENGHKIIKHARHDTSHSLLLRIKMRFTTAWLIVLFVTVASGDSISSSQSSEEKSDAKVNGTTEATLIRSTTEKPAFTNNDGLKYTRNEKQTDNDQNDLAPDKDMTVEELLMIEKIIDEEDKIIDEKNLKNSYSNSVESNDKTDGTGNDPENPFESKINKDFVDIRRQETSSNVKNENSSPGIQFDDSKIEVTGDPSQRFGQRSRKFRQRVQDGAPLLQLTQGGYERPFKRLRFRDRYSARPDSSEQSENIQQPDRISNNRRPGTTRIVSQVAYSPSLQPPYALQQGPLVNSAYDASARNMMAMNQILPPAAQNEFLNSPPTEFPGYSTTPFQSQFSPSNDAGSFPNFSRGPNNVGLYQTLSSNPFQTPGILFQDSPQIQHQPVLVDDGRNVQPQFQQNPIASYPGFQTMGSSSPNYAALFRNSAMNTPFQIPSNFYASDPNAINPFNSPPISFLSQYPNFENGVPPQLHRHPGIIGTQNNQQSPNNQQLDSDASQDDNKAKVAIQNADKQINRDDQQQAQFEAGLQADNVANVYMRYPTVEAGYAIQENLPSQNSSEESGDDSKQTKDGQTNIPNADPYKNILNSVRSNQRINNSFNFPPEIFRNVPIEFGYQRPQGGIFAQYPERNRGVSNYPSSNFESRIPFNAIASLPENFRTVNNQQRAHPESNETPSCARASNASVCFEDNDYPKNDILYSLNSNPFLTDRLLSPEASLNSFSFVERNDNETEQNGENYACDAATKYGMPLRAKNLAGMWRIIVNLQERFSQPLRMEVCKSLGSSCNYADSRIKTACVQKYSLQRLLTWGPDRGIYSEVYKIPVACSCQITETVET